MNLIRLLADLFDAAKGWFAPRLRVIEVSGDRLPETIPTNRIVHLIDDGESWSVALRCPCGCDDVLELLLLPGVSPRWDLSFDRRGRPTLFPSVWRATECRSHFWIRGGRIVWCD